MHLQCTANYCSRALVQVPHVDVFLFVDLHLLLERRVVEQVLQLLVGVVDAQLLQRVRRHFLEPENVQEPNVLCAICHASFVCHRGGLVHASHKIVKDVPVPVMQSRVGPSDV
jgi:hypothetical protein